VAQTTQTRGAAAIDLKVNGESLPAKLARQLIEVEVHEDLDAPAECVLTFWAWDEATGDFHGDDESFDIGSEIALQLGDDERLETVLRGEIVGLEYDATEGSAAQFTVRAYDRSHRLRRGTRQRTFANMKESDIAGKIAQENGLSAKTEDSGEVLDYVLQNNVSDYDFLRERAAKIDFEMVVDDKELIFRKRQGSKTIKLEAAKDLVDLSAHVKAMEQVGAIQVSGWDPEKKEMFTGTSANAKSAPEGTSGESAFGKATIVIVDREVRKQAEADQLARAEFERRARRSMGIEGRCRGRTDLHAGVVVDLQGLGKRFGGTYRILSITHRYSARNGFWTSFSAEKELA